MSRNLCSSTCRDCGEYTFRLEDMRDKPIEFRSYGNDDAVHIGCRCACPKCGTVYFLWWNDAHWNRMPFGGGGYYGGFVIDTSYYEAFNDEHQYDEQTMKEACGLPDNADYWQIRNAWKEKFPGKDYPVSKGNAEWSLVKDNAESKQWVW